MWETRASKFILEKWIILEKWMKGRKCDGREESE